MAKFSLKMYSSPFAVRKWTLRALHFLSFTTLYNSSVKNNEIRHIQFLNFSTIAHHYYELTSVADPDPNPDPDPPDPHVFGTPGSGCSSQSYGSGSCCGSGSGSFYHHAKIVRKTLIPTIQ
jgi:hypothetical protein